VGYVFVIVMSLTWAAFFGGIWFLIRSSRRSAADSGALEEEIQQLRADVQTLKGDTTQ
jgi:hypothetical protein